MKEEGWTLNFIPNTKKFKPYSGWEQGLPNHLVFLIRLNQFKTEHIIGLIKEIQEKLSESGAYIPFPNDYLHITIKALGFLGDNDYPQERVDAIISKVPEALSQFNGFKIKLRNLNLFPAVIYSAVSDAGKFGNLNNSLLKIPEVIKRKYDFPKFIPHMSLGTYKENTNINNLIRIAEQNKSIIFGEIFVDHIDFVIAHWHKSKFPKFKLIKRFEL